MEETVKFALIM